MKNDFMIRAAPAPGGKPEEMFPRALDVPREVTCLKPLAACAQPELLAAT